MSLRLKAFIIGFFLCCGSLSHVQALNGQTSAQPLAGSTRAKGEAVITLERTPGYWGMAPAYTILIYADGSVEYVGHKNVKMVGKADSRITQAELQQLIRAFEGVNYFSLRDSYGESDGCPFFLSDGPGATTTLRLDGKKKSVFHDSGCQERIDKDVFLTYPKGLTQLEDLIDAVVNSGQWVTGAKQTVN
jgi:hypothetical protein